MDKFQAFEAWAQRFRQVGIALQPLASIGLPAGLQFLVVFLHDCQQARVLGERIIRFRNRMRRILMAGSILGFFAHSTPPMTWRRRASPRIQSFSTLSSDRFIRELTSANDNPCKCRRMMTSR